MICFSFAVGSFSNEEILGKRKLWVGRVGYQTTNTRHTEAFKMFLVASAAIIMHKLAMLFSNSVANQKLFWFIDQISLLICKASINLFSIN